VSVSSPERFAAEIADETLGWIQTRVAEYRWGDMPPLEGWTHGTDIDVLRELCAYWLEGYDWRAREEAMNRFQHFRAAVDGIPIHFIHERGSAPRPRPLVLTHGWPGSVVEFLASIEPLAYPERFGGDPADGFDVVVPSLPGYAFSGRPPRPIGPKAAAAIWDRLMREVLGYERYVSQGGDWGGIISAHLGGSHSPARGGGCAAVHLNLLAVVPELIDTNVPEERAYLEDRSGAAQFERSGYMHEHATRPQTLGFGMMDSPVGAAAWILEKFHAWSDLPDGRLDAVYTKDQLLDNIMLYVATRSFNTATWMYRGSHLEGHGFRGRIEVPVGYARFPKEIGAPVPRGAVERLHNLVRWTDMPRGGHFAAFEQPELFTADLRAFGREVGGALNPS
jgi:pimeloyl-ACP methyl ester carboxylesterase